MGRPRAFSNQQLIKFAKEEYERLKDKNPSFNDLMYNLMVHKNFLRLRAMDAVNMFIVDSGIKLRSEEEKTTTATNSEYEELKKHLSIIGHFDKKEIEWLMTFPESWKELLEEIYENYMARIK